MNICIISGSTRPESASRKVTNYLASRIELLGSKVTILDLHESSLPLYDDSEGGAWETAWAEVQPKLENADGFIFISPEWNGMMSVGIHNLLHYCDKELADKPVLLVGVSSGRGGRYPLQQMRIMGYKNKRFVAIPESLFYEHISEVLVDNKLVDQRDTERADYALNVLMEYAKALAGVRSSGIINYDKFPNGL